MLRFSVLLLVATAVAGEYTLPGANRVVLRVAESGLAGGKPRPVIEIYGDGRVRHRGKVAATKMTRAELQDLLRFAVETHRFFKYDAAAVERKLKAREPKHKCGTGYIKTHVAVAISGKRREFGVGMLATAVTLHLDIKDIAHLFAIERRIRLELKLAQSGGRAKVTSYLQAANLRLRQRHPAIKPFRIEEFTGLTRIPKGEMILPASWDQNLKDLSGECAKFTRHVPGKIIGATVSTDAKAKPRAAAQVQD